MLYWILGAIVWVGLGIWGSGYQYAYFQKNWPIVAEKFRVEDTLIALRGSLLGPICLIRILIYMRAWNRTRQGWLFPGCSSRRNIR